MQIEGNISNVHQAASNGDPRGGDREHLHFYIGTHPNTFFNEHVLV